MRPGFALVRSSMQERRGLDQRFADVAGVPASPQFSLSHARFNHPLLRATSPMRHSNPLPWEGSYILLHHPCKTGEVTGVGSCCKRRPETRGSDDGALSFCAHSFSAAGTTQPREQAGLASGGRAGLTYRSFLRPPQTPAVQTTLPVATHHTSCVVSTYPQVCACTHALL